MARQRLEAEHLIGGSQFRSCLQELTKSLPSIRKGRRVSTQCSEPELGATIEAVAADALRIADTSPG
jgi:hypothetical protein